MATKSLVPRANGEGSLGTAQKKWGNIYADSITLVDGETLATKIQNVEDDVSEAEEKAQAAKDTADGLESRVATNEGAITTLSGGKVSKSDVTNNLTTEVEGKVLDARQGKVLSDKIYSKTHNYSTQEIYVSPLADYTVPSDGIFVAGGYGGCLIEVLINGVSMALFEAKTVDSTNNTYFSFRVNQGDTVYVHTNNATACNGCKFRPVA